MCYDRGMKKDTVNTLCYAPFGFLKGQENLYKSLLVLGFGILTLPGCVTSDTSAPLAPSPPEMNFSTIEDPKFEPHYFAGNPVAEPIAVELAGTQDTGFAEREQPVEGAPHAVEAVALGEDKCRIQDRFDRKALLAYEWEHKRLGLDVDGIGLGGGDDSGIKLEYTINLQRQKNKYQKCRYSSQWQGLIGSGYHEMFIRQENTVWEDLRDMRRDVSDYMDGSF